MNSCLLLFQRVFFIDKIYYFGLVQPFLPCMFNPELCVKWFKGLTLKMWALLHLLLDGQYSNHLKTELTKSKHYTFQTLFCWVFKWSDWSDHMIRRTIWIPVILDHTTIFVQFSDHHLKLNHLTTGHVRTIWIPDTNLFYQLS